MQKGWGCDSEVELSMHEALGSGDITEEKKIKTCTENGILGNMISA